MKSFRGRLTQPVSFQPLAGPSQNLEPGAAVTITVLKSPKVSNTLDGRHVVERAGSFIATYGNHSFDITSAEFVPTDAIDC